MTLGLPTVSIVIPSYNAEAFLKDSVSSCLAQTYTDLEVLVVDHGSTDGTRALLARLSAGDSRVRCIPMAANTGRPAVARNVGLQAAKGEFVAFLDADDRWTKGKLADQVSVMRAHSKVVMTFSVLRYFGNTRLTSVDYGLRPFPFAVPLDSQGLEHRSTVPLSGSLCRLSVVRSIGGFDERPEMTAVEDYDLFLRLADTGPLAFVPRIHGGYRVHRNSLSRDYQAQDLRIRRLLSERNPQLQWKGLKQRHVAGLLVRNLIHLGATHWLQLRESADRLLSRPVPVQITH